MNNSCKNHLIDIGKPECATDFNQNITKLEVRENEQGDLEVRINGEGKWHPAKYNEETQILSYVEHEDEQ